MRSQIKIIEEKDVINIDEYLEAVQQAKTDINTRSEELSRFVVDLLRSVQSIGDDDFYNSVKDEVNEVDRQLEDALDQLNLMERELNELKEQSTNKDLEN